MKTVVSIFSALWPAAKHPQNSIAFPTVRASRYNIKKCQTKTLTTLNKQKITLTKTEPNSRNLKRLVLRQTKGKNLNSEIRIFPIQFIFHAHMKVALNWKNNKVGFLWTHTQERVQKKNSCETVQVVIWILWLSVTYRHAKMWKTQIKNW